jgi:EAL domain-containing protein (putative c-di-GMP-specific phosphodiesterase class I)
MRTAVALSAALALTGQVTWYLGPGGSSSPSPVADMLLVAAAVVLMAGIAPALFAGLPGAIRTDVALDAVIIFLAGLAAMGAFWQHQPGGVLAVEHLPAILAAMGLVSASAAGFVALLAKRVQPGVYGPWAVIDGLMAVGLAWIVWYGTAQGGSLVGVLPTDFLLSGGILLLAYGVSTWHQDRATSAGFRRFAQIAGDILPVFAVLVVILLDLVAPESPGLDMVEGFGAAVVCAAGARQLLLLVRERRAKLAEVETARRLERMTRTRAETIVMLSRLEPGPTPEETAARICTQALRLDGIDTAVVRVFTNDGVIPIAISGLGDLATELVGHPLPVDRAERTVAHAQAGSWLEVMDPSSPPGLLSLLYDAGLRGTANATLRWNDRIIGAIGLGTRAEDARPILTEHVVTAREFAIVAAALLGPALGRRERTASLRRLMAGVIGTRAFHPVYQPIVDLATAGVVGYEALTRFEDGCRPDRRFAEAASVGMGPELEIACVRAAVEGARTLPVGPFLSVNVSPELAVALRPLAAALAGSGRPLVLEITEHDPIDDYTAMVSGLRGIGEGIRIAVDDAGAGYAGLRQILEMRPDVVKLDIALVRGIDTDPARRALASAMVAFAFDTGAIVLAEGIETEGELETLRSLGVTLGQGFLLARPAPAPATG